MNKNKKKSTELIIKTIFINFIESEKSGGVVLIFFTLAAIGIANSIFGSTFIHFWHTEVLGMSMEHWVNDGLMTIFFLLIGLELEREIYIGELSDIKNALLPIIAAVGGMVIPAGIHLFFNYGSLTQAGAGIPMATDIAFSLGILSLFGKKVPFSLKVFLTALAIADDLGAVAVIAIFYTDNFSLVHLLIAMGIYAILFIMGRMQVLILFPYLVLGAVMWYFMLQSGVHATVTGVLLAFAIPFGTEAKLSDNLQHFLHKPVAFIVLPIFALANTCIVIHSNWYESLLEPNSIGILLGLVIGKPVGILLFCAGAIGLKVCTLPEDTTWRHIIGAGLLAGIGFTMSIFVAILAFSDPNLINFSQIVVLTASLLAGVLGAIWFIFFISENRDIQNEKHT
ncbi:MAG: Na+/H+ antiporter NhaA [Flavobacterium sp.]|nr:MAG: Na+/H+ antiporter NhaA [Flavobacterium sp.]